MDELYDDLTDYWANNDARLDSYWNNESLIERSKRLARFISRYSPESIYELGMYNGRNLKYMHEIMPNVRLGGCDPNPTALNWAREKLPDDIIIEHLDALNMNTDEKYDIIFTHGVLMHIDPNTVPLVIDKCLEKANKYVIHMERPEQNNKVYRGPKKFEPEIISEELRWAPNVLGFYALKGYKATVNKVGYFTCGAGKKFRLIVIPKNYTNGLETEIKIIEKEYKSRLVEQKQAERSRYISRIIKEKNAKNMMKKENKRLLDHQTELLLYIDELFQKLNETEND